MKVAALAYDLDLLALLGADLRHRAQFSSTVKLMEWADGGRAGRHFVLLPLLHSLIYSVVPYGLG